MAPTEAKSAVDVLIEVLLRSESRRRLATIAARSTFGAQQRCSALTSDGGDKPGTLLRGKSRSPHAAASSRVGCSDSDPRTHACQCVDLRSVSTASGGAQHRG